MKKKGLKRFLSAFLAIVLSVQLAVTPVVPVSAVGVSEFFIDKMVDIGMRVACEGILALSESAEASGYDNVSKTTAFVAKWGFMDAAEVAAVQAGELCEEILAELEELEKVVNNNDAAIYAAVNKLQWFEGKDSLSDVKKYDIGDPIAGLTGELEAFEAYVKVRNDFPSDPTEEEQKALDDALRNFLFALSTNTDATPDKSSFKSLGDAVFTTQEVSTVISNAIDNLVAYLVKNKTGHEYNVMSTAMEYAYYYYPYSHQQYDYVMTQVKYQLAAIMEVMLMYNEFLALQYDYLTEYVDIKKTEGSNLYGNYNGWVEYFDNKMVTLSKNIVTMLNTEYQVSPYLSLSISDYMKPADAKVTLLQGKNSDGSTYTYDAYKLMTNTDNRKKNVYYLYGYDSALQWYNESDGKVLDEFNRISAPLSDGCNTYQMASSASDFKELFNTNAFSLNGGKIRNNLYDFDDNGNVYSLLSKNVSHLGTSTYKEYDTGIIGKEYYAEFQMLDVDKSFTSMDNLVTEAVNEDDTDYKAVVFAAQSTYSQNVTAQTTGLEGSALSISSGSTTIGAGETKPIPSGDTLTIKFKLPEGCRNFTLECRRTYDTFSADTARTSSEILLDERVLDYLTVGEDGYYSLTYQMPYSECTFVLDANEFTYDEEGRIVIGSYGDLEAVENQIKNNPSLYADKSYIVTADITIPADHTLEPIGTDNYPFTGTFDGQGYTISNLKFSTSYSKAGLFGVNKGTIKNLDLSGAEVSGDTAGAAAGYSTGTIENVHVYSSSVNSSRQGGGICGIQNGGTIRNCSTDSETTINAKCSASESNFATGGIVGKLEGTVTVEQCMNTAGVKHYADNAYINTSYTGGIIGLNSRKATVQFCINTGAVECGSIDENHSIGGICGGTRNAITISNCANRGNLTAETQPGDTGAPSYVGGILGLYDVSAGSGTSVIKSCYSASKNSVTFGLTGGIVCGGYLPVNVENCYYDSTLFTGGIKGDMIIDKVTVTDSGAKTTVQFNSGEVTYLLNKAVTDGTQAWYQNLDNEQVADVYPTLDNNGDNTVYANFEDEGYSNNNESVSIRGEIPFIDVEKSDWFYEAVKYAYENTWMIGTSATTFTPNMNLTRAQFVTVLYRMAGSQDVKYNEIFSDVTEGRWYTDAVIWANEYGVTVGYGDGTFGTNDNITREQMMLMIYRYAKKTGYSVSQNTVLDTYPDSEAVSSWAEIAVKWAVGSGLIEGYEDGTLEPLGNVTRAQCAMIISRFEELQQQY